MDKATVTKAVVKGAAGLAFSALLGYVYKAGKLVDGKIDNYFAPELNVMDSAIQIPVEGIES